MCSMPSPSSPSRFAAGTSQSSKTSSAVVEARMPSLSLSFWPSEKPGEALLDEEERERARALVARPRVDEEDVAELGVVDARRW